MVKHGGDIYSFAKELKIKEKDVIDFSSNINTKSPKIRSDFNSLDISSYADNSFKKLKKVLSKKYSIKSNELSIFNGGSSAIFELIRESKKVTLYAPLYGEYKRACEVFNKEYKEINRLKNLYTKPLKKSLIIFVNPSTPDGKYYNLKKLFKIWKKQKCKVLIDESFLEFEDLKSFVNTKNRDLYILKSLTKFYSCAGVRAGIIISHKQSIKELEKRRATWNLSTYDTTFIMEALQDKKHVKRSRQVYKQNKKLLSKVLKRSKEIQQVYKSNANFFLTKLKSQNAASLQKRLKKHNILIRDCSNFTYLNDKFVRFALNSKKDIKVLKRALEKY